MTYRSLFDREQRSKVLKEAMLLFFLSCFEKEQNVFAVLANKQYFFYNVSL